MCFTDESLLPENQAPLTITVVPYGPMWMPGDCTPGLGISRTLMVAAFKWPGRNMSTTVKETNL